MNMGKKMMNNNTVGLHLLLVIVLTGLILQNCGSSSESQCSASQYMAKSPGKCDEIGTCTDKPVACTRQYDPVCGCDGITYSNPCEAAAAGVNVSTSGECPVVVAPCTSNADGSDPEEYCQKPDGDCSGQGVIQKKPEACTMQYDPVCGCDGTTYGNACDAAAAGINVLSKGSCSP